MPDAGEELAKAISATDAALEASPNNNEAVIVKIVEGSNAKKGIYRISVPIPPMPPMLPQGFTFCQMLLVDDKPLLWHTGTKGTFPAVAAAIEKVMPLSDLAFVGYAHCEADECGAMNLLLEAAPNAVAIGSGVEAATYGSDAFIRPPLPLEDGAELALGDMTVQYMWTPHTPHGWGTGFLFEKTTKTLFAGDLFTQHGINPPALAEPTDVKGMALKLFDITDYWVWHSKSAAHLERLADLKPSTLLVMHGSSFREPLMKTTTVKDGPTDDESNSTATGTATATSATAGATASTRADVGRHKTVAEGVQHPSEKSDEQCGGGGQRVTCTDMIRQLGQLRLSYE